MHASVALRTTVQTVLVNFAPHFAPPPRVRTWLTIGAIALYIGIGPVLLRTATFVVRDAWALVAGAIAADSAVLAGDRVHGIADLKPVAHFLSPPMEPGSGTARTTDDPANTSLGVNRADIKWVSSPFDVDCPSLLTLHRKTESVRRLVGRNSPIEHSPTVGLCQ